MGELRGIGGGGDPDGGHNYRIGLYAVALSRHLGLSDAQCDLMLHAAALHDVGKIGVPESILLKPGPLTDEERQIVQAHVLMGVELLSSGRHALVRLARTIALTHHERWDGAGYPNSLAGEAIPIEGRIVAVCDVFDALTSDRPYKEAWSWDRAVAEILDNSGKAFDPKVVEAFRQCQKEFAHIRDRGADTPCLMFDFHPAGTPPRGRAELQ